MIFLQLFLIFFKIGLFTIGGGYAMLPLIQAEIERLGWMSNTELVNFIAVSESTPGPFAINSATYVGTQLGGVLGAICSTLGVVMPSFIIILIIAAFFEKFKDNKIVVGCMTGLKPAVIGLIGSALISIGSTVFFNSGFTWEVFSTPQFYISLILFVIMTVCALKKVHPVLIICVSAIVGIISGYILNF